MNCIPCRPTVPKDSTSSINQPILYHAENDQTTYQYIVIGGGTAGCPLAASLAKKGRTLLLERGNAKEEQPELSYRAACLAKAVKWSQTQLGSWAASANVLGGGSTVNGGIFMKDVRGGEFFNEHEFLDWNQVESAYEKVTEKVGHERHTSNQFQTCVTEAMKEAGLGEKDIKTDTTHYGIYHPYSLYNKEGKRSTAACLLPGKDDFSSQNLTVMTNVLVRKIIFDTQACPPRAIGVEFQELKIFPITIKTLVEPSAEFYISAGTLRTPQLLMLSGIGNEEELKRNQIELVLHNPHVGMHLKDKPVVAISVNSRLPVEYTLGDTMAMTKDYMIGTTSGGHMAEQMATITLAMFPAKDRSAKKRRIVKRIVHLLPAPLLGKLNQQFTLYIALCNPISEGSVALSCTDEQAEMSVFSPGFNDVREIRAMAKGLQAARDVVNAAPLRDFRRDQGSHHQYSTRFMRKIGKIYSAWCTYGDQTLLGSTPVTFPMLPDLDSPSSANFTCTEKGKFSSTIEENEKAETHNDALHVAPEVERWLKGMYTEGWTYTSTCRFGDVVNEDFTVKGVNGLSIVDASVLKRPPRVNGAATMMMLGFYAGELAKAPPISSSSSLSMSSSS